MESLSEYVKHLYNEFGQRKPMGFAAERRDRPHFFLHRTFLGDQDLLVIFNSKRCRYQCNFCQLPAKSSRELIPASDLVKQFEYVVTELKHSLSIINRVTLANEGSILDRDTFPEEALFTILESIAEIRLVHRVVLESRLEFCDEAILNKAKVLNPRATLDLLTGFETVDENIRDNILFKRQTLAQFTTGLDILAGVGAELTCYILFKPDPAMTDFEAVEEAMRSFRFLKSACESRNISLRIRLNPMYVASGSKWEQMARKIPHYKSPRLTDVMRVAEEIRSTGIPVYIGISSEGLDIDGGTFHSREDFKSELIRPIKLFNDGKIDRFTGR